MTDLDQKVENSTPNEETKLTKEASPEQEHNEVTAELKELKGGDGMEEDQALIAAKKTQIFSAFNLQKFMMEFMGSFAIIFFGNWAQIFSDLGMSNQIAVSLVIGLFMTIFTWIGTDISGAHFNPITTVSRKRIYHLTALSFQ